MTTMSHPRLRVGAVLTGMVAAASLLLGAAVPAVAAPPSPPVVEKLVALGDSYAAGQGAAAPMDSCLRSAAAYPVLLDAEPKLNLLRNAACSGAEIADVAVEQLGQVNRGTTLVTLTVGANDLGVGAVYAACSADPASAACAIAVNHAESVLSQGVIVQGIAQLVGAVAERAPHARIVVTDYPVPFAPNALFDPQFGALAGYINAATELLDLQIQQGVLAAASSGVDVVGVTMAHAFAGHQVGDAVPWLGANPADGLTFLHPTAAGQGVYRDAVVGAL